MDGTLLSGLDLVTSCNGLGACASCKIQVSSGVLSPITAAEHIKLSDQEINEGVRLACQAKPLSDLRIYIPSSSLIHGQQLQIDGVQNSFDFDPIVKACDILIPKFGPHDTLSDWERIQNICLEKDIKLEKLSFTTLQQMSNTLRDNQWEVRVIYKSDKVIHLLPANTPYYGIAFDIGSTKIASYWVDLQNGSILLQAGFMNPQISLGEDVVNRIAYANQSQFHQNQLQNKLIQSINEHIQETCKKLNIKNEQVVDMVVVGNSVIHHLFCGISVRSLGEAPYTPVIKEALDVSALDLKLDISPGAEVFLPPLIAGYVGADHTAALIATRFRNINETACLIDVGTNTEISLIHNQKIFSCSCASGPAFEGAHIHDGMRAAPGAIDQVKIINNEIHISTIMQKKPVGICGSGILSAIAEMSCNQIIDHRGVFQKNHVLTKTEDGQKYVILAEREQEGTKAFRPESFATMSTKSSWRRVQFVLVLNDPEINLFIEPRTVNFFAVNHNKYGRLLTPDISTGFLGRLKHKHYPVGQWQITVLLKCFCHCRNHIVVQHHISLNRIIVANYMMSRLISFSPLLYSSSILPTISSPISSMVTMPTAPPYSSTTTAMCSRFCCISIKSGPAFFVSGT